MKIAFASTDNVHINDHFGWCKCFYLYELAGGEWRFVKALEAKDEIAEEIDKLGYKIERIKEADILCAAQIGPRASLMVKSAGIFVLKSEKENKPIEAMLCDIVKLANENPPLWLKRFL
ncbi:MAG: dinitrogenase iron-molybdenum cofactor biosynthesis protein [Campylobacteraceae bacterium]|jgi:nitrogen fixation protein NifX|nr:dinitrogenase iron-molybdenum cofactor biosynthesis protein [Campylobacteraceae bacterium]